MSAQATVTRAEFDAVLERIEDLEDALYLQSAETDRSDRDYLSVDLVERLVGGESPVRLWREHRGLTVRALADLAAIDPSYLSQIETGKKPGSVKALRALAAALRVTLDDLVQ